MEREKSAAQLRFGANPKRFCFTRKARSTGRRGIGDLRVVKGGCRDGAWTRIDIRLRESAAQRCGLAAGDPVELSVDVLGDDKVFYLRKVAIEGGMLLSRNSRIGNDDVRASFTEDPEVIAALFGNYRVFTCNISNDYGEQNSGIAVFQCVRSE